MSAAPEFQITYWGTIGSFPRSLPNPEIERRIAAAITGLFEAGCGKELESIAAEPSLSQRASLIRSLVRDRLPPALWSVMGTHTTCIQIRTPESEFLVDAGTGLLEWSRQSSASSAAGKPSTSEGHLFLTHAHLDHVCSLPFADIFYHEAANFTIWGLPEVLSELQSILSHDDPRAARMFPMALRDLKGIRSMQPIVPGQSVVIRGTRVDAARLCHPGGSLAYRFQRENRRVVIATDHEHAAGDDITLVEFAANANLLYLDAQYRDAEYRGEKGIGTQPPRNRSGWGHSTLEASLRTAALANVATLHLGHHDPNRSDQELFALREQLLQGAESEEMRESPAHLGLPRPPRIDLAQDGMSFTVE